MVTIRNNDPIVTDNDRVRQFAIDANIDWDILTTPANARMLRDLIEQELVEHTKLLMLVYKGAIKFWQRNGVRGFEIPVLSVTQGWKNRQGITLEPDGWIGFAGWADSDNTAPFLRAFVKWIKILKQRAG